MPISGVPDTRPFAYDEFGFAAPLIWPDVDHGELERACEQLENFLTEREEEELQAFAKAAPAD